MKDRSRFVGLAAIVVVLLLLAVLVAACSEAEGSASVAAAPAADTTTTADDRGDQDVVGNYGNGSGAAGRGGNGNPAGNDGTGGNGAEAGRSPDATHLAPDTAAGPLSQEEQTALLYLREEEKLAHDVYVTLYEKWGTRVFDNISASELRHMDSVKSLLDSYGLADPVRSDEVGVFTDPELQGLYDSLVAQGSTSAAAALEVGVTIETKDIEDLEALIAFTTHSDVREVAENLLAGSRPPEFPVAASRGLSPERVCAEPL